MTDFDKQLELAAPNKVKLATYLAEAKSGAVNDAEWKNRVDAERKKLAPIYSAHPEKLELGIPASQILDTQAKRLDWAAKHVEPMLVGHTDRLMKEMGERDYLQVIKNKDTASITTADALIEKYKDLITKHESFVTGPVTLSNGTVQTLSDEVQRTQWRKQNAWASDQSEKEFLLALGYSKAKKHFENIAEPQKIAVCDKVLDESKIRIETVNLELERLSLLVANAMSAVQVVAPVPSPAPSQSPASGQLPPPATNPAPQVSNPKPVPKASGGGSSTQNVAASNSPTPVIGPQIQGGSAQPQPIGKKQQPKGKAKSQTQPSTQEIVDTSVPASMELGYLGLSVQQNDKYEWGWTSGLSTKKLSGLRVAKVDPQGAMANEVNPGDVILEFQGLKLNGKNIAEEGPVVQIQDLATFNAQISQLRTKYNGIKLHVVHRDTKLWGLGGYTYRSDEWVAHSISPRGNLFELLG